MRKKLGIVATVAVFAVMFSGCVSSAVTDSVKRNVVRCDAFIVKMENGGTTRDQERSFIKANRAGWHSMNYYLNDKPLPEDLKSLLGDE